MYQSVGLERSRKVLLAYLSNEHLPSAVAICNLAPVGLNLSFLENRTILMFKNDVTISDKIELTHALLQEVKEVYQKCKLNFVPLLVQDPVSEILVHEFKYELFKKYNQSIWGPSAYLQWYKYIENLYSHYASRNLQINPSLIQTPAA